MIQVSLVSNIRGQVPHSPERDHPESHVRLPENTQQRTQLLRHHLRRTNHRPQDSLFQQDHDAVIAFAKYPRALHARRHGRLHIFGSRRN